MDLSSVVLICAVSIGGVYTMGKLWFYYRYLQLVDHVKLSKPTPISVVRMDSPLLV